MAQSLTNELDLRFEAGAASEFRDIAALDGFVSVPKVDWTRTSRRVLTTEWVDARSLTDPRALDGVNRQDLANRMTRGFLACALDHGFFHADMHEGNIMVSPEGELTLIDFGIMGRIGMNERRFLAEILHGFLQRDYRRVAEVHFEAGYVPANRSMGDFAQALRSVGEPIFGQEASNVSMGRVLVQLLDITEQFGMRLRPELILLQKTMVQVEGVSRSIDPDHNIWTAAQPIVARWTRREFGPERLARTIKEASLAAVRLIDLLPSLVDRLHPPKLSEEGPKAQKSDLTRTRRPSRLVWAIIGAAVLWASAYTVQTITLEGAMLRWVSAHLLDPWRALSD
jgi:ubiquinone biosynthesis protein